MLVTYEPHHEKTRFSACAKTKAQISFAVATRVISGFVFTTRIVQFLFSLNPKFHVSSHLLLLHIPVCVRPCQRPVLKTRLEFVASNIQTSPSLRLLHMHAIAIYVIFYIYSKSKKKYGGKW